MCAERERQGDNVYNVGFFITETKECHNMLSAGNKSRKPGAWSSLILKTWESGAPEFNGRRWRSSTERTNSPFVHLYILSRPFLRYHPHYCRWICLLRFRLHQKLHFCWVSYLSHSIFYSVVYFPMNIISANPLHLNSLLENYFRESKLKTKGLQWFSYNTHKKRS